jgi:5-formyltetrahydrofolate cyclo-ligase
MEKDSFKMVLFRLPLERKKFGIFEPKGSTKLLKKIDLAIVPIVGVDSTGRRIGYGKGMYDRFFDRLQYAPKKIFIQYKFCYSKEIITDFYDITADYLLTPTRLYSVVRKKNDKRITFKRNNCIS